MSRYHSETVYDEADAMEEGKQAFCLGADAFDNPYHVTTSLYEAWDAGFENMRYDYVRMYPDYEPQGEQHA